MLGVSEQWKIGIGWVICRGGKSQSEDSQQKRKLFSLYGARGEFAFQGEIRKGYNAHLTNQLTPQCNRSQVASTIG